MSPKASPQPKVKRMNINMEAGLHNRFKVATAAQGENMTDVLMKFIQQYVEKHFPEQFRRGGHK